ncbi:MAG: hypothetical protein LBI87_10765 [Candidatus Accumulibacter sp.]|jgi:hypothetical protein|nr:hypothetical protein [Accumulibacter sp.]
MRQVIVLEYAVMVIGQNRLAEPLGGSDAAAGRGAARPMFKDDFAQAALR